MTLYYGRDVDPDELREQMLDTLRLRYLGEKCPIKQHELFIQIRELNEGMRRDRQRSGACDTR